MTSALAFGIDPMDGHAADMAALAGIPLLLSCANLAIGPKAPRQPLQKQGRPKPKLKVYEPVGKGKGKGPVAGKGNAKALVAGAGAGAGAGVEKFLAAFKGFDLKGFDPGAVMASVAWVILSVLTPVSVHSARRTNRALTTT